MKIKKIGAILFGTALIGASLASATAAADVDVPDRDFFIDTTTGMNDCLIVVGSGAAAADVVSAAYVAAQIGSMAYYENVEENWTYEGVYYDGDDDGDESDVDNYVSGGYITDDFEDYTSADTDPESSIVLPYACDPTDVVDLSEYGVSTDMVTTPWWDYDVYVDASTAMEDDDNFLVDTGCSYECITVDFSLRDTECSADLCVSCSAACDQDLALSNYDLLECQSYPNVYPRHYWGTPEVYADNQEPDEEVTYCDPTGGIEYRTIVYGLEDVLDDIVTWSAVVGPESEAYQTCDDNSPQLVSLYCSTCDVYFLGKHYDALSFDTDANGYDYMFYGTPQWYVAEMLKVGESKTYGDYTMTINDLNIYENKVYLTITTPDGESYEYISVINTYTSNTPSNGDADSTVLTSGSNEENDAIAFLASEFEVYTLCGDESDGVIDLDQSEVLFAVQFTKTFIGAAGSYVVEYNAYSLDDYGVLKEQIYPDTCDSPIEPAIDVDGLEWYFDIIPGDEVDTGTDAYGNEILDLDNDVALYESGNPNFDVSDSYTVYDPESNSYLCDVPILELWLATPVELSGQCADELSITLNDCEGSNYFTLTVTDEDHSDYIIDGSINIYRKVELEPTVTNVYVDIDPEALIQLDEAVNASLKNTYNLILIGGPVANSLVQELVDLSLTTYEQWENATTGDLELIEDAYADGRDVLIVAGSDREATAMAALDLVSAI
ncbi:MAG TPA: S-layer protein [Candidatus Methanofastidiosa archaeon]|nr:S-layer protein [Candidatus Methanofastidiosa archaeon]